MVMKVVVPSGFLRVTTRLFQGPKSKITFGPSELTSMRPRSGLA